MQTKKNKELVPVAKQLRKNMTKEERHLWYDFLRSYPLHIYRQRVLGKYIVDFYCAKAKLVIELDGSQHYDEENMKKDAERTTFLDGYGLKVIRIEKSIKIFEVCVSILMLKLNCIQNRRTPQPIRWKKPPL